jgi:hypothetical protein
MNIEIFSIMIIPRSNPSCSAISLNTSLRVFPPLPMHLCFSLPLFRTDVPQVSQV